MVMNALARQPRWDFEVANVNNLLQPIQGGIDRYNRQVQQGEENRRADEQLGFQREQLGMQRTRMQRDAEKSEAERIGQMARVIDSEADPAARAALLNRMYQSNPRLTETLSRYGIDPNDAGKVPKFLMAQAGAYDPLGEEKTRAQIAASRASANLANVQAQNAGQPEIIRLMRAAGMDPNAAENRAIIQQSIKGQNPADVAIANMLAQAMPPRQAPSSDQAPPATVRPMSDTGDDQPSAMLIPTQTAPSQPAQQSAVPGSMFANMPPEQKRATAEAFLLSPRTKALGEQLIKDLESQRMGKEARNAVEKKEMEASEGLAQLQEVRRMFRPEFQTIEGKIGMSWTALRDRFKAGRANIPREDLAQLEDYSKFRSEAFNTVNDYIKSVTGAAMTNAEAERILRGVPNPGANWWEGDSPTQFKAKLDQTIRSTQLAMMRTAYARTQGRPYQAISIPQMERIIEQRGNQLFQEMRSQGTPPDQIAPQVRQRLRQEFGGNI